MGSYGEQKKKPTEDDIEGMQSKVFRNHEDMLSGGVTEHLERMAKQVCQAPSGSGIAANIGEGFKPEGLLNIN
eukprot:32775-Alexandrium_andersonii.AAC.1